MTTYVSPAEAEEGLVSGSSTELRDVVRIVHAQPLKDQFVSQVRVILKTVSILALQQIQAAAAAAAASLLYKSFKNSRELKTPCFL